METEGLSMVTKTNFSDYLYSDKYDWAKGSYVKDQDGDRDVATLRGYLDGNVADIRLSTNQANTAVSMVQTLSGAATTIFDKLKEMESLVQKVTTGYHSTKEKASMQEQLEGLAGEVNKIVDNIKYNNEDTNYRDNKLFTAEGKTISVSLDNDRTIKFFPKDLSFDAENVDLTQDAKGALSVIRSALAEAEESSSHIGQQKKHLLSAMSIIEDKMDNATSIGASNYQPKTPRELLSYLGNADFEQASVLAQAQSNITTEEATYLLAE